MQSLFALQQCKDANYELCLEKISDSFLPDLNSMEVQDKAQLTLEKKQATKLFEKAFLKGETSADHENIKIKINELVKKSVLYAFSNPSVSKEFISMHAQEMSEEVRMKHIELYVNVYSIDIGLKGRQAIEFLLGFNTYEGQSIFVN